MSARLSKQAIKQILGELPLTAEVYYLLRHAGRPLTQKYSLAFLKRALPDWCAQVARSPYRDKDRSIRNLQTGTDAPFLQKKVFLFGTQRYWIEHTTLLGCALAGFGHQVTLAYLPYAYWHVPVSRFDLRQHALYTRRILKPAEQVMQIVSFFNRKPVFWMEIAGAGRHNPEGLPEELERTVHHVALRDTQYTLQLEEVDLESDLYHLRLRRNMDAARVSLEYLRSKRPDVVILPNGTILEYGVIYQVACYLQIPVVTYEFGEQKQRIWLAQNGEVMRQETDDLWRSLGGKALNEQEIEQIQQLFSARQRASLWGNFARRWQGIPSEGGERVRALLGLDSGPDRRPVVLLATNVIGDSLTLDRQVFSRSMTEWIERTVEYFYLHPESQLVIRIHPGELVTKGPSVANVVTKKIAALSGAPEGQFPEHIHLVPAEARINTYDIMEIADLGLVYTTTVGMEMAMSGLPVIASGRTHYRGKGFTLDVDTWEEYFDLLNRLIADPVSFRLTKEQVDKAWNYAYRFFFNYPLPFPWHLQHMQKDVEEWPLERVWSAEGLEKFGKTFQYLVGEPIQW